jgi:beta-lactamase regulating signal transducer with metallopeptidase domain
MLSRRPARARYAAACLALAAMLALPVATYLKISAAPPETPAAAAPPTTSVGPAPSSSASTPATPATDADSGPGLLEQLQPWIVTAWIAGVLALSFRLLLGFAEARWLTRRAVLPAPEEAVSALAGLCRRLAVSRPVRLLSSFAVEVPTAVGTLSPIILVPASAFTGLSAIQLEAMLAHELAHIRRADFLVNLLQSVVETLLFYHPAVWWVSGRIRVERENCCDDLAVEATGNARAYAAALAEMEGLRAPRIAAAASGGRLIDRVSRLIAPASVPAHRAARWLPGALAGAALLLTGAAVRWPDAGPREGLVAWSDIASVMPAEATSGGAISEESEAPESVEIAQSAPKPATPAAAPRPATSPAPAPEAAPAAPGAEPSEGKKAASRKTEYSVEDLIGLKAQGVTASFVREIRALGYDPDVDELIALKIHGLDASEVRGMTAAWGKIDLEDLIAMKIHGVTPEFARAMKDAGATNIDHEDLVAMKIHGVTPELFREARKAFPEADADDIVAARIHGVQPGDAAEWQKLGYNPADMDTLVALRIHGVTPEFGRQMQSLANKDLDDLVAFKIHGVTPALAQEVARGGWKADGEDLVALKIHGVTPQDLEAYKQIGVTSLEDAVSLKIHGISAQKLQKLRKGGANIEDLLDALEEEENL